MNLYFHILKVRKGKINRLKYRSSAQNVIIYILITENILCIFYKRKWFNAVKEKMVIYEDNYTEINCGVRMQSLLC
jgi:hypothetical protein